LGNVVKTNKRYTNAIEAGLGSAVDYIIFDKSENVYKSIQLLKKHNRGKVTFVPLDRFNKITDAKDLNSPDNREGFVGLALDLVDIPVEFQKNSSFFFSRMLLLPTPLKMHLTCQNITPLSVL